MNIDDGYNYVAGIENDHPEKFGVLIASGEFLKEIVEKADWQKVMDDVINFLERETDKNIFFIIYSKLGN